MSDGAQVDYDALAKQFGGTVSATPAVDYEALAKQYGGTVSAAAPSASGQKFIEERKPEKQEGFFRHAATVLGTQARSLGESLTEPITKARDVYQRARAAGQGPGEALGRGAMASILFSPLGAPARQAYSYYTAPEAYRERRQQGYSPAYSAVAPQVAPLVNVNLPSMEHQADIGNPTGVYAEAAVPAAEAAGVYGARFAGKPLRLLRGKVAEAAMEHPDVAALKAQGISPNSQAAGRALEETKAARPYLKGTERQAGLVNRAMQAKAEIWQPYKEVIDRIGNRQVNGPDGPTTVGALEKERLELAAQNRGIKFGDPAALQEIQQKGLTPAQNLAREKAVKGALDPELRSEGIDPAYIRQTHGAVKAVLGRVQGREGGLVKQPMGLGKVLSRTRVGGGIGGGEIRGHGGFLSENLGTLKEAGQDIAAGRGWWSGSPADIATREGFRIGGPKPNFEIPPAARPWVSPTRQLPQTAGPTRPIPMPMGETQGPLRSPLPVTMPGTRAERLGLLLPERSTAARRTLTPPEPGPVPWRYPAPAREFRPNRLLPERARQEVSPEAGPVRPGRAMAPLRAKQFPELGGVRRDPTLGAQFPELRRGIEGEYQAPEPPRGPIEPEVLPRAPVKPGAFKVEPTPKSVSLATYKSLPQEIRDAVDEQALEIPHMPQALREGRMRELAAYGGQGTALKERLAREAAKHEGLEVKGNMLDARAEIRDLTAQQRELLDRSAKARDWRRAQELIRKADRVGRRIKELRAQAAD